MPFVTEKKDKSLIKTQTFKMENNAKNTDLSRNDGNTMLAVVCFIFGHKYKVTKRITKRIAELQCKRCRKEFGINTSCKSLLPLDKELKELHKSFSNYS